MAYLKGKEPERPTGKKGITDDELRAMASATAASDKKREEDDLGEVQRLIEQAAKDLQLDAEKTVEGIALNTFHLCQRYKRTTDIK